MVWPAWAVGLWVKAKPYADRLAVWRGYEADLTSLTILTIGIALYTVLVFTFYQALSHRQTLHSGVGKGRWWGTLVAAMESTFVFPVMSFLYFAVLAGSLFLLAKSQSTYQIFLLSMAVVAGVRFTSFLTELAAVDLAKLLPLSLLGVLVVDPTYATWAAVWARYQEIPELLPVLGRFFLLFLVFETALRILRAGSTRLKRVVVARHAARVTARDTATGKSAGTAAAASAPAVTLDIVEPPETPPTSQ